MSASTGNGRGDAQDTTRQRRSLAFWVCLLLVFATVSWRPNTFYSGGLDPVVLAKAVLSMVALTMAWNVFLQRPQRQPLRSRAICFLIGYLSISTFGAWTTGDVIPSLILSFRVFVLATVVVLLVRSFPRHEVLRAWLSALMTVGLIASFTGLPSLASGRLRGGIPPLHPNEIAILCGLPAVGLAVLIFQHRSQPRHTALLGLLLALLWLTGSRTSLMATLVAILVVGLHARRLSRPTAVIGIAALGGMVYMATATSVLDSFFLRGGEQNITTLSSRTIAWSAAWSFSASDWVRWMGAGLSMKEVPVVGQYWESQVLDSSWMSALVQAGRAGLILLAVWAVFTLISAFSESRADRMPLLGLLTFIFILSYLQSGLVDSAPSFITFFMVSLVAGAKDRTRSPTTTARVPTTRSAPVNGVEVAGS